MMAHLLNDAGVSFGNNLLDESVPDNVEGYGEHASLVQVHESLLESFDRSWHSEKGALPLPSTWLTLPETLRAKSVIKDIVVQETLATKIWAIKDPRISRLLPLWLIVCADLKLEISLVVCFRNPISVADSLATRNEMTFQLACKIWQQHYDDLLASSQTATSSSKRCLTKIVLADYDRLVDSPEARVKALLASLFIAPTPKQYSQAVARIKSQLRHHLSAPADIKVNVLPKATQETFKLLSLQSLNTGVIRDNSSHKAYLRKILADFKGRFALLRRTLRRNA